MSATQAIVCDCCGSLIAFGPSVSELRKGAENTGGPGGAVYLSRRDMCGKCWGRGCEFGKKHLRRSA